MKIISNFGFTVLKINYYIQQNVSQYATCMVLCLMTPGIFINVNVRWGSW